MPAAAKRKIPTLAERIQALKEEIDGELDRLAEQNRPANIPAPWLKQNWLGKANGNAFEALLIAARETNA
jgi:hypothetical protein